MGYQNIAPPEGVVPVYNRYRDQFPVTQNLIYLNHASIAPLCKPAADAIKHLADDACLYGSLHYPSWLEAYSGVRKAAAQLIGASPDEIALVKNTSEGIAMVAQGLQWKPGDRVVAFREEFPANYYPWQRLSARGVDIQWLSIYDPLDKIAEALPGARLLSISHVNYLSGYRVDLAQLGKLCNQHGCFFFVDAIQGMGALPIDVEEAQIDALAADGHKWMLGPEGHGILYVRRSRLDEIEPVEFGWCNPANYNDYASRDMTLRPDAGRYECGTLNTSGCFGHRAAMEFLLSVGMAEITSAVLARAGEVDRGVRAKGYQVLLERTARNSSGIVSFKHPVLECRKIARDLQQKKIVVATRQGWLRASPHFYTSPEDIECFLQALPTA